MVKNKTALDSQFIDDIKATGISSVELGQILKSNGLPQASVAIVLPEIAIATQPTALASVFVLGDVPINNGLRSQKHNTDPLLTSLSSQNGSESSTTFVTSRSLPAWRNAEQYVVMMFDEHGYQVEDRSRQNLGYDIYVEKDGRKYYVEVKLLDYAGQPFIITTNEEVVAREYGDAYIIALALHGSDDSVHIQLIRNPTTTMKFVRQCRQWVWECSDYEFKPSQVKK